MVPNTHHHPNKHAKTMVADVNDIIDHMIQVSYNQLSLKLYQDLWNVYTNYTMNNVYRNEYILYSFILS